jgi:hypothetical protein
MGQKNTGSYALVVMTNKDVYYISLSDADMLGQCIESTIKLFYTKDVKSGADLRLQTDNISSIVVEESRNA